MEPQPHRHHEPHRHQQHQQQQEEEEERRARSPTVTTTASSFTATFSTSSTLAYDREFLRTLPGILMVAEIVLGLLVWTLIAGTEYFMYPVFGWGLCFNGSAFLLYFIAAIVDASAVTKGLDSHNYNSWAASSFFAFVVTSCYGGNAYFSFVSWRSRTLQ
ncbi:CKLF-like MARVEL transmembrane domain-containing protein 8 isoform X2 [Varanus komodoensis]|uniref:CKLF-like MARVEL transmembrane domain-containing protein 8 isoform X2 n=1 Tax=Varanus komodoensis TaxID=61221 RepID=UPI001CF76FA8|nr:CKLF-like MARVEL transmembrane domain-containing protein 8 isoform X2 [Varanus komodoensis]